MKALLHIVSALLLVALAAGCRPSEAERALRSAEALMETRPDSALTLLEAIDGSRLSGEPRARHALLLSQAYDKNYIDLTDDSLISIAVNFYDNSSDDRRRMLALHYKGTVNRNAGFYESALASALEAHDIALALNDTLNLCRIESAIAYLYSESYSFDEALRWELSSLQHAKTCARREWITNGYFHLTEDYLALGNYTAAMAYVDSLAAVSGSDDAAVCEFRYHIYYSEGQYSVADSIFSLMIELGYEPSIKTVAAQSMNPVDGKDARIAKSKTLQSDSCVTFDESYAYGIILAQKCINANDPWGAIDHYKNIVNDANHLVEQLISQSLLSVQADHEQHKSVMLAQKLQTKRLTIIYMTIISALLLLAAILLFRWRATRQRNRRMELEMNLRVLSDEMAQIKTELAKSQKECQTLNDDIAKLFIDKFSWIEKFGSLYLDADMPGPIKERSLVQKMSEVLSSANLKKQLSDMVTELRRHDCEFIYEIDRLGLLESEKQLLVCMHFGFSTRVICLLTGKTQASIYNLKKRLRQKLQNMDLAQESPILRMF